MDKYDTYEPRPSAEAAGKKILDSTWVIRAKPDGTIKCRIAGQKFVDWAAKQSESEGFERSLVAPWFFHHGPKDISMEVHMDDFHGTGPEKEAVGCLEALSLKVVMKYKIHRAGDTYEHLRRLRTLTPQGMFVQPNPKYLQSMLRLLSLEQANPAPTPETASKDQQDHPGLFVARNLD
eukprot:s784_g1.t1